MIKKMMMILCVVFGLLPAALVLGQEDETPVQFEIDPEAAVILHGEQGEWDSTFTDPGAVIFHDGLFHMFRNGFQAWPADVDVAYHTSEDGFSWTEVSDGPIIFSDDAPFDATAVLASSALVEDDGTWVLYFYAWPRIGGDFPGSVVRATAPEPLGPWTFDAEPILQPDPASSWENVQITAPSVVVADGVYYLYYSAFNAESQWSIGLATSEDGVNFERNAEPVLAATGEDGDFDGVQVHQPRVVVSPDGFVMLYRSFVGGGRDKAFGLAISEDGSSFERLQETPVFSDSQTRVRGIWWSELVYADDTYFGFFEIQRNYQNQTDIYTGTLAAELLTP